MRVVSWNVNGLRAALKKGLPEHLERLGPDVLLLQEIRARPDQLPAAWRAPAGWEVLWHPAERPGYAGVAVWSRHPMEVVGTGTDEADPEGRVARVRVKGVQIASIYLPSGSSSPERQQVKDVWMDRFLPWAKPLADADEPVLLGGDLNIAHTELDIHNPKGNQESSGFLPHERAWFGRLLASGWRDVQRTKSGPVRGPYSWWSNRGRARELDRGWRIDYLLANAAAASRITDCGVDREGGLTISDHGPVWVDIRV